MNKKYVVRLTDGEREILKNLIKKLKGSSEKVRRAQILFKADADGPNWTDKKIAEAYHCRIQTIEYLRERLVTRGFEDSLNRKKRETPPRKKTLDGVQEAKVIALRLGKPPKGFTNWSLRLLAEQVVELEIVDSVSHETLRSMLKKKWYDSEENSILGYSSRIKCRVCCLYGEYSGNLRVAFKSTLPGTLHG